MGKQSLWVLPLRRFTFPFFLLSFSRTSWCTSHFCVMCFSDTETSEKIQKSGVLQVFASLLTPQSSCTAKVANIIAEVARNGEVFYKNFSAGTSSVFHLTCQYVLLHLFSFCRLDIFFISLLFTLFVFVVSNFISLLFSTIKTAFGCWNVFSPDFHAI